MTRALDLTFHKFSESTLDSIPPPSTHLHHTHALAHVKEYAQIICTLAPNTISPSNETTKVLRLLHPLAEVDLSSFVDDFHPEIEVTLDWETFVSNLVHSSHLSSIGPSSMVYELLRDCFVPNDFTSGFDLFFEVCGHIV
jgi:hypothetical protein